MREKEVIDLVAIEFERKSVDDKATNRKKCTNQCETHMLNASNDS
jgi:hypothetical protein